MKAPKLFGYVAHALLVVMFAAVVVPIAWWLAGDNLWLYFSIYVGLMLPTAILRAFILSVLNVNPYVDANA